MAYVYPKINDKSHFITGFREPPPAFVTPSSLLTPPMPNVFQRRRAFRSTSLSLPHLSNFRKLSSGIRALAGVGYSVEAAYQSNLALLLGYLDDAKEMLNPMLRPDQVKRMGSKLRRNLSPEEQHWLQEVKPHIMRALLYQKFEDQGLQDILVATGTERLIEAGPTDRYWGVGLSSGQIEAGHPNPEDALNWMGRLLEEVRDYYGKGTLPDRNILIIGNHSMSAFSEDTVHRNDITLICRPAASLAYLLTLAEACAQPALQNIIVGGGYLELLPPSNDDQVVPTARTMAYLVIDTVGRFNALPTHFTFVPPILHRQTPIEIIDKLALFYLELKALTPRPRAGKVQSLHFLNMSSLDVVHKGPIYEEPKLPKKGHDFIMLYLQTHQNAIIGHPKSRVLTHGEKQNKKASKAKSACKCTSEWWCEH